MVRVAFGIFLVLHGLVHLLYVGQSARVFELQEGMVWPDGAWAFSRVLGNDTTRMVANTLLVLAAVGFIAGGVGVILKQGWWHPVTVGVAVFSTVVYLLMWDGGWQHLDNKGGVGILINLGIIAMSFLVHW